MWCLLPFIFPNWQVLGFYDLMDGKANQHQCLLINSFATVDTFENWLDQYTISAKYMSTRILICMLFATIKKFRPGHYDHEICS